MPKSLYEARPVFFEVFATVNFSGCKGTTMLLCFTSLLFLQQNVQAAVGKVVDVVGLMFIM